VNSSPKAVEWARELNEAYSILSDANKKASYDMDLRQESSKQARTNSGNQQSGSQTRTETRAAPAAGPSYCCEKCQKVSASLRITVLYRVMSLIYWSQKTPLVKILCNKCRIKASLSASFFSFLFGWWGFYGFFWTLEALFKNASGGEQPKENNASLLRAVSYQLYRAGRLREAYKALVAAQELVPDKDSEAIINQLMQEAEPSREGTFWEKYRFFELPPFYYHVPAGALCIFLIILGHRTLVANDATSPTGTAAITYNPPLSRQADSKPPLVDYKARTAANPVPEFSEPEVEFPHKGLILAAEYLANYNGTTGPFKLTTPSDGNYIMKVEDWDTKATMGLYFIPKSSVLTIELPLGSYKLKFAQGDKWYGIKYLFGPGTAYSYVPDKMEFYISGDYVKGHQIELVPQINGNLKTPPMQANDW
jgi:curved DNA-binding protein CbpA